MAKPIGVVYGRLERLGERGPIYVAIQCGCGWYVSVSSEDGLVSNWDLRDAAESRLADHLTADETDDCRPWIR